MAKQVLDYSCGNRRRAPTLSTDHSAGRSPDGPPRTAHFGASEVGMNVRRRLEWARSSAVERMAQPERQREAQHEGKNGQEETSTRRRFGFKVT
jgi:hypothetical protein